jgi:hypothetical protein
VNLRGGSIRNLLIFLVPLLLAGCKNPFAPAFDATNSSNGNLISDQKTIDGVFQNFQYSYAIKDSSIYGNLLYNEFKFIYRDYDQGFDVSWGRDEDMKATYGLFQNAQQLNLIWNNIILSTEDSLSANIVRGFNLTITFNPTDVIRLDGRVNLFLSRATPDSKWQITQWIDESQL